MRSCGQRKSKAAWSVVLVVLCLGLPPLLSPPETVAAASLTGDSHTILRLRETADNQGHYPLHEYLNLSADSQWRQGFLTANFGGWGRVDLRNQRTGAPNDKAMQYGRIGYRGNRSNLSLQAGRQFIAEGVAAERLDGIHLRSDLAGGFTAAAFAGSPVVTQLDFKGGDLLYGGRIAHTASKHYTIGISALRVDEGGDRLREEEGIDLWVHPFDKLDIVGRSSYNSITSGWMEHTYNVMATPLKALTVNAGLSAVNYRDYFHNVTTSALRLTPGVLDPREKVLSLGGSIDYTAFRNVHLSADYKNYRYDIAGSANYYGGKVNFLLPAAFTAGLSVHRMDGETASLRFDEVRVFISKRLGKADLTADFFNVTFDSPINGVKNTYAAVLAGAYEITRQWRVAADIEYSTTVDFDSRISGLVRLTYYFDVKLDEGERAKHEK